MGERRAGRGGQPATTARDIWKLVDRVRGGGYSLFTFSEKKRMHDLDLEWLRVTDGNLRGIAELSGTFDGRRRRKRRSNGRRNSEAVFLPLKTKTRLNAPPANQPWSWVSFEMLESGAMRSLSVNARRVLDRIRLEHMAHGGSENGRLKVTWLDFEKYDVGRHFIGKSIAEVVAVGIVAIEQPGRMLHGQDHGDPAFHAPTTGAC